jgi:hypothetical protein
LYDAGTGTLRTKPDPDPDYSGYINQVQRASKYRIGFAYCWYRGNNPAMRGSGRKSPDFAVKAERRARGAVLYLVLITTVLIVVCAAMLWWA